MDCSAFRHHHVAYVDDTLPGDLLVAAVRHVAECPACARHDTAVRRSLLLARNMCQGRGLECSPDFEARLEARLRAMRSETTAGVSGDDWAPRWWELATAQLGEHLTTHRRTRQVLAAAAMLAAVSAGVTLHRGDRPMEVQGLGSGPLSAAPLGPPFGSPFAPVSATSLGETSDGANFGGGSAGEVGPGDASDMPGAVTFVVYDGDFDAGALVAPAAVGVPVWAAAVLAGEVPAALWRDTSASSVQLVRVGH